MFYYQLLFMQPDKIKNKGQGTVFQNGFLEMMTKTHPMVIYSMYIPVIVFCLYYALSYLELKTLKVLGLFFLGLLTWTLVEYILHRYIFHIISESPRVQRIIYKLHGVHHEYPRDQERLFMPPIPSLIIACIFFSIQYLIFGAYVLAFFSGFLLGYLLYGSLHYAIHAFAPPKFLKALWRNHHLHHYKYPEKGFGVSSVLWDIVFGTHISKKKAEEI